LKYLILSVFALAFCLMAFTPVTTTSEVAPAFSKGKILFKAYKCTECHSVAAVGMEATTKSKDILGSDLSGYKSETAVNVKAFKTSMHSDMSKWDAESKAKVKGFKGTDEELQAIVDWLGSLEAQE
jgi:cytochrome c2